MMRGRDREGERPPLAIDEAHEWEKKEGRCVGECSSTPNGAPFEPHPPLNNIYIYMYLCVCYLTGLPI